jgi:hypothetical protein
MGCSRRFPLLLSNANHDHIPLLGLRGGGAPILWLAGLVSSAVDSLTTYNGILVGVDRWRRSPVLRRLLGGSATCRDYALGDAADLGGLGIGFDHARD